jgi:hypothetical protein
VLGTQKTETKPSLIGEKADTPPGSQATACCPREYTGTWENLCLPSSFVSKLHKDCGFTGTR